MGNRFSGSEEFYRQGARRMTPEVDPRWQQEYLNTLRESGRTDREEIHRQGDERAAHERAYAGELAKMPGAIYDGYRKGQRDSYDVAARDKNLAMAEENIQRSREAGIGNQQTFRANDLAYKGQERADQMEQRYYDYLQDQPGQGEAMQPQQPQAPYQGSQNFQQNRGQFMAEENQPPPQPSKIFAPRLQNMFQNRLDRDQQETKNLQLQGQNFQGQIANQGLQAQVYKGQLADMGLQSKAKQLAHMMGPNVRNQQMAQQYAPQLGIKMQEFPQVYAYAQQEAANIRMNNLASNEGYKRTVKDAEAINQDLGTMKNLISSYKNYMNAYKMGRPDDPRATTARATMIESLRELDPSGAQADSLGQAFSGDEFMSGNFKNAAMITPRMEQAVQFQLRKFDLHIQNLKNSEYADDPMVQQTIQEFEMLKQQLPENGGRGSRDTVPLTGRMMPLSQGQQNPNAQWLQGSGQVGGGQPNQQPQFNPNQQVGGPGQQIRWK